MAGIWLLLQQSQILKQSLSKDGKAVWVEGGRILCLSERWLGTQSLAIADIEAVSIETSPVLGRQLVAIKMKGKGEAKIPALYYAETAAIIADRIQGLRDHAA
jgi:hypothetical protein